MTTVFITSWSNVAAALVTVNVRILRADGVIIVSQLLNITAGARVANTTTHALPEGHILSVAATCPNAATPGLYVYVNVGLFRGVAIASNQDEAIFCGYIGATNAFGFPESVSQRQTDGAGCLRTISGADPAAGVEISETVPTGARWELIAFRFTLVTSAVVANRDMRLVIDDGANVLWQYPANAVQAASQTRVYTASMALPQIQDSDGNFFVPIPQALLLTAGFRIRTLTGSIDAGDNYSAPQYLVREWLENA